MSNKNSDSLLNLLVVFGTRPEAIKLAPLIRILKGDKRIRCTLCVTAQHREMLDQVLECFSIQPDYDLNVMSDAQSLESLTTKILERIGRVLEIVNPDVMIVHGDTTTTFAAALSAFYKNIPVAHVEAGLRTGDLLRPWPEEANRKLTAVLSELHFAPTEQAKMNLLKEGIKNEKIHVTGNTIVDALKTTEEMICSDKRWLTMLDEEWSARLGPKFVLITGHRRESHGKAMENIFETIKLAAHTYPDVVFLFPVHLNPTIKNVATRCLVGVPNILLERPLDYPSFVYLMKRCHFIITDSGGIQEEALTFRKPMLVTRDISERQEAIQVGAALLVGSDSTKLGNYIDKLILSPEFYESMQVDINPFGDGLASQRIHRILIDRFGRQQ